MRVLITGITGLLGMALQNTAHPDDELFGVHYPDRMLPVPMRAATRVADVADPSQLGNAFEWARPDVVVHAASIGSVDFAEKHKEQTRLVNVVGTQVVTELCRAHDARLIYISSNAVFDGKSPPYAEADPVTPLNYYGALKVESEQVVASSGLNWAIVRPILMYGWPYPGERDNPVTLWLRSFHKGNSIKVVDNVYSKPLYAASCAEVIWAVMHQEFQGIVHAAGRDHVSLYDFALITADVFEQDRSLVVPVPDSHFPELAPRPRDTSFVTDRMEHELGLQSLSVVDGLRAMRASRPPFFKID